jgi:outer membrane protein TolC
VLQARLLLDSLDEQRGAARAGYLPRFDLELSASSRDNAGGEVGRNEESRAMINMRMPLFDGGAREAAIGRISARIRQAEFEVERAERDAEQAVRNDYSALSSAWEKVDAIEDEVAAAERLVELYDEQFRQGARSVFDLLDGQSTLYQAQVRRESNRTEMRISGYRVLRTLGSLFDTITMPPAEIPQLNRPTPRPRPTSDAAHAAAHDHPTETDAASMPPPPEAWAEDDTIILLPDPDEPIPSGRRSAAD